MAEMRRMRVPWRSMLLVAVTASLSAPVRAEDAPPVAQGASTGYELALHGALETELGQEVRLFGVAYTVDGLAALREGRGLAIEARITVWRSDGNGRETISRASTTAGADGRFSIAVPVPARSLASPRVELTVSRPGQPGRTFEYGLQTELPHQMDLLLDRRRYQPGEKVRVWLRATDVRGRAPLANATIRLTMLDQSGRPAAERTETTSAAGVASTEIELPESAGDGSWQLQAELTDGGHAPMADRYFEVTRRTVERLQASMELDQDLVRPGERLTGRVTVRTPSGAPVRGARVEVRVRGASEPLVLRSNADGAAPFATQAPAFLSGEVATEMIEARVVHPAHGTIRAQASYLLARVQWRVEVTPEAGAVIPEVDHQLFLTVSDPMGRPIGAGTTVTVRGEGLLGAGGEAEATTDARGLAVVEIRLPRGAASRRREGACAGSVATSLEVEVEAAPPVTARLCVAVAPEAKVLIRADDAVVEPGAELGVSVQRRPDVARRPVLVEALWSGRAVAWSWIPAGRTSGAVEVPANVRGLVLFRARPVLDSDRRRPLDEPGATALDEGSLTAALARPADAYSLAVDPARELWRVRQEAEIHLRASQAPRRGWAALLARDEAAHGGEEPWVLHWIRQDLRAAASAPDTPDNERFLRVALAGTVSPDGEQAEPPPLIVPPWQSGRSGSYTSHRAVSLGVLRDPVARREELIRRGMSPAMRALEAAVSGLGPGDGERRGIVRTRGRRVEFDPEVISHLIAANRLNRESARTLGGELLTVAMITGADPSFTFDSVARRVARARLVTLLQGLQRLADPENPNAARAIAGEPPERWLSKMVQLEMISPETLVDPWGRSFAFRRTGAGRDPVVVISERAVDYELVSPGPDGVLGNGDDVRDPFERAVEAETPYAVASGEDRLMEQLSRIAPGPRVLEAMAQAYRRLGLAAREERRRGPVEATASEDDGAFGMELDETREEAGGGGFARRARAPARPMATVAPSEQMMPEAGAEPMADAAPPPPPEPPMRQLALVQAGPAAAAAALIREDFPATLFFVAEVPLDDQGQAEVEVPLADALTTYRLEAISWTASGWVTSASGRIRVDQEAMVDAPVPPFATVGDLIRLPVRVANRTGEPIAAQVTIEAEGDLALGDLPPRQVEVPPNDAVEVLYDVRLGAPGEGALVIRAVRAGSEAPLDAVRRPLAVLEDARLARERREVLLEAGDGLRIEVPSQASPRGPGELRLAVGSALFGDPAVWGRELGQEGQLWAAWALTVAGRDLPEVMAGEALSLLPEGGDERWHWSGNLAALALSALWRDDRMSDAMVSAGLMTLSEDLPAESAIDDYAAEDETFALLLLALAPALSDADRRSAVAEDLRRLEARLRDIVSSQAARATEAPTFWALAAASLGLSGRGEDRALATEMLRRAARHVIQVGDEAWLESPQTDGTALPRIEPTSLLALARVAIEGDRQGALTLLKSLVRLARHAERWPFRARALAAAAASRLAGGPSAGQVQVSLDGRPVEVRREEGLVVAVLEGLGRPGAHTIDVQMGRGEVALAWLDVQYGLPWSVEPRREAPVDLEWTGEVGARDGRAGLLLSVRNRGARIMTRPTVEIEVPAGTELDEYTRDRLAELLAEPASQDGRTLRLVLRPLAPGGYVRVPLPLRWSLSGTLIGLGTTVWDDRGPSSVQDLPVQILPSRGVEIADRGEVPTQPDAEASPMPRPPPPPPIRPLDPLGLEEVTR